VIKSIFQLFLFLSSLQLMGQLNEVTVWEISDNSKNIKLQWEGDEMYFLNDSLIAQKTKEKIYLKNILDTAFVFDASFDSLSLFENKFIKTYSNKLVGIIDLKGNTIRPTVHFDIEYDTAGFFNSLDYTVEVFRFSDVINKNKKRRLLFDASGKSLLQETYRTIRSCIESTIAIQNENGLWGYANTTGQITIPPMYEFAEDFKNGFALVRLPNSNSNNYLLIDKNNKIVFKEREAQLFYLGVIRYQACNEWIKNENEPLQELHYGLPPKRYSNYTLSECGFIRVKNQKYTGVINKDGKEIVQAYQDTVYTASSDSFFLYKRAGGQIGYSDKYGNTCLYLTNDFENIEALSDGYSKFTKDGLYGFIDVYGNIQIAPKYDKCRSFSNGMAAVFLKNKWGFIDKDENLLVQPYYKESKDFRNGFAPVKNNSNKWIFIDKSGKALSSNQYDDFWEVKNQKYIVVKKNKQGITYSDGKEILSPKYEAIEELSDNYLKIKKDGKFGVMDYEENIIFYYQYDDIRFEKSSNQFLLKTIKTNITPSNGDNLNSKKK